MWLCLENGLEEVVNLFNGLAGAVADLGSYAPVYIAMGINLLMIAFESFEVYLTRKHGGKQTACDRFFFGQVRDATGGREPSDTSVAMRRGAR